MIPGARGPLSVLGQEGQGILRLGLLSFPSKMRAVGGLATRETQKHPSGTRLGLPRGQRGPAQSLRLGSVGNCAVTPAVLASPHWPQVSFHSLWGQQLSKSSDLQA